VIRGYEVAGLLRDVWPSKATDPQRFGRSVARPGTVATPNRRGLASLMPASENNVRSVRSGKKGARRPATLETVITSLTGEPDT